MKRLLSLFLAAGLLAGGTLFAQQAKKPQQPKRVSPMASIKDVAGLPRVLIIGDSISIGYTLPTRKLL
ncbi:MAG: SGNH/GDSL hydrolase family protein, partial [Opitutales bacterium]